MALHILGTGLNCKLHLNPETAMVLKQCKIIYALLPDKDTINYIQSLCPMCNVIDCYDFYKGEKNRPDVYEKISKRIILEAKASKWNDLAFISYGHPLFLVSATEKLIIKANEVGLKTIVYPAVTSLDTIICDLKLEIGYCFSVYDASLIINEKIILNSKIPTFIFQAANLNDSSIQEGDISYEKLQPLSLYLSNFYSKTHEMFLVASSENIFSPTVINKIQLKDLQYCKSPSLKDRPTIYIPSIIE